MCPVDIDRIGNDIQQALGPLLNAMAWADEEIIAAQRRHPATAGHTTDNTTDTIAERIGASFALLRPTHPLMERNDRLYRAHCKELLDRVAVGADTRPGTAAECCVALSQVSLQVPLSTSAAGLYARMWRLAGLPPVALADAAEHYEALEGSAIDDHEAWLRQKLRQDWRSLRPSGAASTATRRRRRT
jgi:hypothetical protein